MPTAPCDILQALDIPADLHADAGMLTGRERSSLDEQGFVLLSGLADEAWLATARARYEELVVNEGADLYSVSSYKGEFHREVGCRRLADLVNKGSMWDHAWLHPRILAVVAHVLGRPFKLSALSGRDAQRGFGRQGLHADWGKRSAGEPFHVVNCIWALDGLTTANGATRLVPGSHVLDHGPDAEMEDCSKDHPRQRVLEAPPGTVVAMNSHTWHGGTDNQDGTPRRTLHAYFCAREHSQQLNQREHLRVRTADRLPPAARWLLDA